MDKLGIIACGGHLPRVLIDACFDKKQPFQVYCFNGQPMPENLPVDVVPTMLNLAALGRNVQHLKQDGVDGVVLAGYMSKPSLLSLKPDFQGMKFIASLKSFHDDAILSSMVDFIEKQGFDVFSAHDLAPHLLVQKSVFTKALPSDVQIQDIALGITAAKNHGKDDLGQAVVVQNGQVLGLEDERGTDSLLRRCKNAEGAVLVKCVKPQQTRKVDMPTIGLSTIEKLVELKFSGVAVLEQGALFLHQDESIKLANEHGVFICGVDDEGQTS